MTKSVTDYLESSADKYKNKIAFEDEKSRIGFEDLREKAKRTGSFLIKKLRCKNKPVAVFLNKSVHNITAFMGIAYSGNIYVPIDVSQPKARLEGIINVLDPAAVVTDEVCLNGLSGLLSLKKVILLEEATRSEKDEESLERVNTSRRLDDPLYIIFTSGSTGVPKGVCVSHRSVIDYIDWAAETYSFSFEDRIGNQAPFYFDNSVLDIYTVLKNGCSMNLIPEKLFAFPAKVLEYLTKTGVTSVFWVPSVLINIANSGLLDKYSYNGLRRVLFAGEIMPNKQLNIWRKRFPDVLFSNLYGPTEITVDCAYYIVDRAFEDNEPLPIGFSCRNTDIFLLDEKDKEICNPNSGGGNCASEDLLLLWGIIITLKKRRRFLHKIP